MRNCFDSLLQWNSLRTAAVVSCLILIFGLVPFISADEGSDSANSLLENLKRRSAEERWQRIKRLYPVEGSTSRVHSPAQMPENQSGSADDVVPPSPDQTSLAPRIAAFPADASHDWVIPARPSPLDEEPFVPSPAEYDADHSASSDVRSRPMTRVAALQDAEKPADTEQSSTPSSTRNVLTRKISDITPFYDRDRDTDIRQYADEKIKEYEGQFHPKTFEPRTFPQIPLNWEASNIYYRPLYFADPALERYGHSYHPMLQPFVSIARFGIQTAFLPYQMTIQPICSEESPLGWYRPGECAPKLCYQPPLNAQAAAVQAGFVTGLYFIIP